MKISIITATYNSAKTVRDTIESVLSQTYQDWELIIKDGGSKDNTLEICREFEPRCAGRMRILSYPDKGIYDAMNQGIGAATGDIVGILNSDDMYYDETVLADIVAAFSDGEIDATCGDLIFVDEHDTNKVVRNWQGSEYQSFLKGWHPAHPTFYAKKDLFDQHGVFDTSFDVSADFELMLRFIEKYGAKVKYIPRIMVKMRQGGESTGSIKNILKGNKNIVRAFKKNDIKVPVLYTTRRLVPKAVNMFEHKLGLKK